MIFIYILLVLFSFSCTNVSYNQLNGTVDVNITSNLNADITVGDKISGTGSETIILWLFRLPGKKFKAEGDVVAFSSSSPSTTKIPILSSIFNTFNTFSAIENAKGQAIYDAIELSNADLIINPKFNIFSWCGGNNISYVHTCAKQWVHFKGPQNSEYVSDFKNFFYPKRSICRDCSALSNVTIRRLVVSDLY